MERRAAQVSSSETCRPRPSPVSIFRRVVQHVVGLGHCGCIRCTLVIWFDAFGSGSRHWGLVLCTPRVVLGVGVELEGLTFGSRLWLFSSPRGSPFRGRCAFVTLLRTRVSHRIVVVIGFQISWLGHECATLVVVCVIFPSLWWAILASYGCRHLLNSSRYACIISSGSLALSLLRGMVIVVVLE